MLANGEVTGTASITKESATGLMDEFKRADEIKANRECKMKYFDQISQQLFEIILGKSTTNEKACLEIQNKIDSLVERQELLKQSMPRATPNQARQLEEEYTKNRESLADLRARSCT